MGLLGKLMGLPDDESGLTFLLSGRGKSPEISSDFVSDDSSSSSENFSSEEVRGSDYYNCRSCGGDGRQGGTSSYSTIGGACTNCGGTGHVD